MTENDVSERDVAKQADKRERDEPVQWFTSKMHGYCFGDFPPFGAVLFHVSLKLRVRSHAATF